MTSDADMIVERRGLRRKLVTWRVVAFLAVIAAIGTAALVTTRERYGDHIARVQVSGFISGDKRLIDMIDRIGKHKRVRGVIVAINSRGGSTAGGEALHEAISALAKKKPVVATMGTLATSAGYMAALGAEHIVARRATITGSIGVIFQSPNIGGLMDKVGVEIDAIKSSALKAEPSFYGPIDPEARRVLQQVIDDTHAWFVDMVRERRSFDLAKARRLSDGRVFTGRQALDEGLVDALGGEKTAVAWLESEKKLKKELPVRTWKPRARHRHDCHNAA